jgi:hypothetical protein
MSYREECLKNRHKNPAFYDRCIATYDRIHDRVKLNIEEQKYQAAARRYCQDNNIDLSRYL